MTPIRKLKSAITLLAFAPMLSACTVADSLSQVGKPPKLSPITDPTTTTGYRAVSMPMAFPEAKQRNPNSLWETGSRSFFKDNRAKEVGDILSVNISISDSANLTSTMQRSRSGADNSSVANVAGFEQKLLDALPTGATLANLINATGTTNSTGSGSIERSENLNTSMTAVVVQKLPNGNLVIEGRQEVRINHEVRDLIIAGVIRPGDIDSTNSIEASRIAEARISYGGRGVISRVQKPRYGQEVLDILLPF